MDTILGVLVESSVRATIIALAVAGVLWALRVKSPAIRHRAWTGVLAAMLLLPALSVWGPKIAVPLLPPVPALQLQEPAGPAPEWKRPSQPGETAPTEAASAASVPGPVASRRAPAGVERPRPQLGLYEVAGTIYLGGFLVLTARLLVGMLLSCRLARAAGRSDRGFYSPRCAVPVTVGLLRARILLPEESKDWDPDKLDAVLSHEQEHVRRRDPLVEWLALLNRALYWFHPLAWWLCVRLASLAEQACDEAVLARGHDPGKYAELLLELARSVKRGGALVTAWGSSLDGSTLAVRIRKIVAAGRSPALSRTRLIFVTVLCAGAILVPATCELVRAQAAGTAQLDKTAAQYQPSRSDSPNLFDKDAIRDLQRAGKNIGDASGARAPIKADISSESPEQNQETGLKDSYQKWLNEDVVYIITIEEKAVFLALRTDEERDMFIAQFWARREHDPRAGGDQFKKEHYRRLAYANERFGAGVPGWKTDRGRIYILYGEPDGKESHPSGGAYQREFWESGGAMSVYPFERWHYRHINGIGDDVVIEFVDKNLDGSFVMEKIPVQGAAPQGLPAKGSNIPSPTPLPSENQLPYTVRTDFFRIFTGKARVLVTIGLENKDLRFRRESQTNRAQVNVHGAVTSQTGVPVSEFENTISAEYPDDLLAQGITRQFIWSKPVLLNPGERYRLDLELMDVNSNRRSSAQYGILVPKFDGDSLQASSVVLASSVRAVPPNSDASGPFIIGDLQVQPNVTSEYVNGQALLPVLQVYNATVDPATGKPALDISFAIKSGNLILETIDDTTGNRLQIDSNDQVTIIHQIPVRNLTPGQYTLEIKIADRLSNRTLMTGADFHVIRPPS